MIDITSHTFFADGEGDSINSQEPQSQLQSTCEPDTSVVPVYDPLLVVLDDHNQQYLGKNCKGAKTIH